MTEIQQENILPLTAVMAPEPQRQLMSETLSKWQRRPALIGSGVLLALGLAGCDSGETKADKVAFNTYVADHTATISENCVQAIVDKRRQVVINAKCATVPQQQMNNLTSLFDTYEQSKQSDDEDIKSKFLNTVMVGAVAVTIASVMNVRRMLRNPG